MMEFALFLKCIRAPPRWAEFLFNHRTHIKGLITPASFPPLLELSTLASSFLSPHSKSDEELHPPSQG